MATAPATATAPAPRKPLPLLLLALTFPVLLLIFLLSHATVGLLPRPHPRANATSTTGTAATAGRLDVSVASPPPPPSRRASARTSSKRASTRRNRALLKLLLRQTPRTRRFAARAAELFSSPLPRPCAHRFFMTWLSPLEQFGRRELLVVGSLFRWHGDACLLIASDAMDSTGGSDVLRPFLERGFRVAAASPDLSYLLRGTPAEEWIVMARRGGVSPGSVPLGQNLSNLLRLALLYKYGGVYLDADVVVLRPLSHLRNAIGAQAADPATGGWTRLNNAVMVFDRRHPLLRRFIAEFAATFDGSRWGHNGPYLVSRVAARLTPPELDDVTVLPPRAFYPVDWNRIGGLFRAPMDRKGERWVKAKVGSIKGESFGIHLWNRESRSLQVEEGSVIASLISTSCFISNCNSTMC